MKLSNFTIANDSIALEVGQSYYDLHNNFDFIGLQYNTQNQAATLSWKKSTGAWVPENSPHTIKLEFSGVGLFKCKERDPEMPYSEDDCLDMIGFVHNNLIEEVEGFSSPHPIGPEYHLRISFVSGFTVMIGSVSVRCVVV